MSNCNKKRTIRNSPSIRRSFLILCKFITLIALCPCNNDTNPTSLISTQQTHIIPNGSYFQYTFTSMKLEQSQYNASISQYSVKISLQFTLLQPQTWMLYNILVFPQNSPSSETLYQNFVKAANEGLPGLMPIFPVNYSQPQKDCQSCYQAALYATTPVACLNCQSTNLNLNLTSQKWDQLQQWNGTIMTVIDNSFVVNPTGGEVLLMMDYGINIFYEEQQEALFILFFSVVCSLIVILAIIAIFITLRIKKVESQIAQYKIKIKNQ